MKLSYNIDKDEWLAGWELYYKNFKSRWVYVRMAIFLVPLALFVEQVIRDPGYGVGWVCIGICVACMAALFFSKQNEKKNYILALEALKDDSYTLELCEDKLTLTTVLPESDEQYLEPDENGELKEHPPIEPTVIDLNDKTLKAYENDDIIAVMSPAYGCIIPKTRVDANELAQLKQAIKARLLDNYKEC